MEARGGVTRAQIEVGGTSVPYGRAGEGAPFLLLRLSPTESDPVFGLGTVRGRVFSPLVSPPLQRDQMKAWLVGGPAIRRAAGTSVSPDFPRRPGTGRSHRAACSRGWRRWPDRYRTAGGS